MKPVELLRQYIELTTPTNGVVLDPFMGSGSTGVAAVSLNRNFIGMELDEDYFKIAKERIYKAKNAGLSNTQLYKQGGNSATVPVIKAIAEKLG